MEENDAESREICPKYINPVIVPYRKESFFVFVFSLNFHRPVHPLNLFALDRLTEKNKEKLETLFDC